MTDIVERLRMQGMDSDMQDTAREAADEIERLRAALRGALAAMCAQRDNPDAEVFQDAIDALVLPFQ